MLRNAPKDRLYLTLILGITALIYASITFANHYLFRTAAFDLGINNNAIYDYAHFRWNDCMIMQPQFTNVLSDHFSLLPILVSPLYWILGSWTMLVFQWLGILFGGYGIYKTVLGRSQSPFMSRLALVHFFSIWGIYSALAFDYHDNVMAAMFLPWVFYYMDRSKLGPVFLFTALILISKENMALWMVFVGLGMAWIYRKQKPLRNASFIISALALFYFVMVVKVVIPSIANAEREYLHLKYRALGSGFSEVLTTAFTRPVYVIKLLFTNHLSDPFFDGIKSELWITFLLSGGVLLVFRPAYAFMLVPILAQKLLSDDPGKWGLNHQYSIEIPPLLTLAAFDLFQRIKVKDPTYTARLKKVLAFALIISTMVITAIKLDSRKSLWYYISKVSYQFYSPEHYRRHFDVQEMHRLMRSIPEDKKVSAVHFLVPHLCNRQTIYEYPVVQDADMVIMTKDANPYPLNLEGFERAWQEYRNNPEWRLIYDQNHTQVLERVKPVP